MNEIQTEIARPSISITTRADAVAYLTRTGNADLLEVLGLVDDPEPFSGHDMTARGYDCAICFNPLPGHGFCRRLKRCREVTAVQQEERQRRADR